MRKTLIVLVVFAVFAIFSQPAQAQALPNQVQALYPPETGEVVFVDLRALRGSDHYLQIKSQVLPERFRQLEIFGGLLGIAFDREVHQLSWGFVGATDKASFVGVAEGNFPPAEVEGNARNAKLPMTRFEGALVVTMGVNAAGNAFVFAFPDRTTALFGYRETVEGMLTRRAQGGSSMLANNELRTVIDAVNGKAPMWVALDNPYTVLAVRQMLPEAARLPGFDTLAGRLQSTSLRIELKEGLRGQAAVRCATSADAVLLSTLLQAALTYQSYQLSEKNPELSRAVKDATLDRQEALVSIGLAIREAEFTALLQKNTFTLNF